jgi:hypothetical protein
MQKAPVVDSVELQQPSCTNLCVRFRPWEGYKRTARPLEDSTHVRGAGGMVRQTRSEDADSLFSGGAAVHCLGEIVLYCRCREV